MDVHTILINRSKCFSSPKISTIKFLQPPNKWTSIRMASHFRTQAHKIKIKWLDITNRLVLRTIHDNLLWYSLPKPNPNIRILSTSNTSRFYPLIGLLDCISKSTQTKVLVLSKMTWKYWLQRPSLKLDFKSLEIWYCRIKKMLRTKRKLYVNLESSMWTCVTSSIGTRKTFAVSIELFNALGIKVALSYDYAFIRKLVVSEPSKLLKKATL